MKKTVLAILAVFITWSILDYVLHGIILTHVYEATPSLWRPMAEMKMGLTYLVVLIAASCFVYVYDKMISDRGVKTALLYGLVFGIGTGISMGYGTYSVMPIPYFLALGWFLGSLVEAVAAAWIAWIVLGRGSA